MGRDDPARDQRRPDAKLPEVIANRSSRPGCFSDSCHTGLPRCAVSRRPSMRRTRKHVGLKLGLDMKEAPGKPGGATGTFVVNPDGSVDGDFEWAVTCGDQRKRHAQ